MEHIAGAVPREGDVFGLVASEGETMKMWTARVKEVFDVCKRKASVEFPPAARGWVALHCAGLSEEQKAIVKAKTQGSLDHEAVSAALRSCFPLYKAAGGRKKATGVFQVEPLDETEKQEPDDDHQFQDVEAFLAEHDAAQASFTDDAVFSESETAEALAVSWKERKKEIAKFQQSRQFGSASSMQSKRQFRVQVEELRRGQDAADAARLDIDRRNARKQQRLPVHLQLVPAMLKLTHTTRLLQPSLA